MKRVLNNGLIYLPILGVLLVIAVLMSVVVYQSRHADIAVTDQEVRHGRVVIDKAFLKTDGFVAIHPSDGNGKLIATQSIGHVPLEAGLNFNVSVMLEQPVSTGSKLFAVVHRDTGTVGYYEFGSKAADKDPIAVADGKPVAAPFAIE